MIHITGTFKEGWYSTEAPTADFDYTYTEETGWSEDPNHAPTQLEALSTVVMTKDNVVGPPPSSGQKPSLVEPSENRIYWTIEAYLNEFCETLNIETDLFDENTGLDSLGGQIIY